MIVLSVCSTHDVCECLCRVPVGTWKFVSVRRCRELSGPDYSMRSTLRRCALWLCLCLLSFRLLNLPRHAVPIYSYCLTLSHAYLQSFLVRCAARAQAYDEYQPVAHRAQHGQASGRAGDADAEHASLLRV